MINGCGTTACHWRGCSLYAQDPETKAQSLPRFSHWLPVEVYLVGALGNPSPAVMPSSFPTVPQSVQFFFLSPLVNLYQLLHKNQAHFLRGLFLAPFSLSCCLERSLFTTVLNRLLLVNESSINACISTLLWVVVENWTLLLLKGCRFYIEMQMRTILFLPSFYTFTFSLPFHIGWDLGSSILSPQWQKGALSCLWDSVKLYRVPSLNTRLDILWNCIRLWKCPFFPPCQEFLVMSIMQNAECHAYNFCNMDTVRDWHFFLFTLLANWIFGVLFWRWTNPAFLDWTFLNHDVFYKNVLLNPINECYI